MIVDLFAGPGGWEVGAAWLGRTDVIGLEWDAAACETAVAAGHLRIRCDVAQYPTEPFVGAEGVIASPPCQAWSMAGKRKGEFDRGSCHRLADRMADGDDSLDWTDWEDPRSPLVCQPVRWVRDLQPTWIALEEVPAVRSLWEHFARIFRAWGYSVWTGDLCAADYGVPQTRTRRILMAHRERVGAPPPPTHAEHPSDGPDLFGVELLPWVSMASALGWDEADDLIHPRGAGMIERHGPREGRLGSEPAMTVTSKARSWVVDRRTNSKGPRGSMVPTATVSVDRPAPTVTSKTGGQWQVRPEFIRLGTQVGATVRPVTAPAPTLFFGHQSNDVRWHETQPPSRAEREAAKQDWAFDRPATTVVGSFSPDTIAAPGYRLTESRQNAEGGVKVTVAEGGVLQGFPPDYPWRGSRTKQYEQVGNAIPPVLAMRVLAALGVGAESLAVA